MGAPRRVPGVIKPEEHGKINTSIKLKCKCALCKEAYNAYKREYWRKRKENWAAGKVDAEHGRTYTYTLGCRCNLCVAAASASRHGRKDSKLFLEQQGASCAICRRSSDVKLKYDHDHATGEGRGYLCHSCNIALGQFGDNTELLRRAIRYLNNPEEVRLGHTYG